MTTPNRGNKKNVADDEVFWYFIKMASLKNEDDEMEGKISILKEFWFFIRERKKWYLGPIIFLLLLLALLIVFTEGSALAPFIYTLF